METTNLLRVVLSLVFVMALIGICAMLFRRFAIDKNLLKGGLARRLKIEEFLYLDAKRKVVVIKKDDKEFTVLLGLTGETLLDSEKALEIKSDHKKKSAPKG